MTLVFTALLCWVVSTERVQAQVDFDFGDAPPPYPTLLPGGARHAIGTAQLRLGAVIDAEPDGQPSATATGDDQNLLYPGGTLTAPATCWLKSFPAVRKTHLNKDFNHIYTLRHQSP